MKTEYLQVSYREGKPLAAYYYFEPSSKVEDTQRCEAGLLVDYAADDRPVGIEISSPSQFTLEAFNRVLASIGRETVATHEVAPLLRVPVAA